MWFGKTFQCETVLTKKVLMTVNSGKIPFVRVMEAGSSKARLVAVRFKVAWEVMREL